ncbi:MAG: 50S ribosomal protein L19 [Candidatus Jacksonbacteria bacterium]|nr:50S ribosomal protein L19 [Candidatus Jacksonbacteria bacterium]
MESKKQTPADAPAARGKKHTGKDDRDFARAGMIVSVHEKVVDVTPKGEPRERTQIFTGMVLARKHGKEKGATITVRKESDGVGVEKIFPVHSPLVSSIVVDKKFRTRRAKLYFLRDSKKRIKEMK